MQVWGCFISEPPREYLPRMNITLTGRRAFVCGSTQGIGKACAVELARLGASVTLAARNADSLKAALGELPTPDGRSQSHDSITVDFADPHAVKTAVAPLAARGYDILINNTGGPPGGRAIDADPDQFIGAFTMHVGSAQVLCKLLVPGMQERRWGRVVNIISTSVKAPIANLGVSNTVRAAMANWAKTLAGELGPFGITVNNILPGYTDTERLRSLMAGRAKASGRTEQAVRDEWLASIPAGRFGTAEEIANVAAFLCTPAAAYVNGINVPVDGGRTPSL